MAKHILLIECKDEKGIVFKVAETLFAQDCNILSQDEYVSPSGAFFMRTEFEAEGELPKTKVIKNLKDKLKLGSYQIKLNPKKKKDIVVLATKEHHCLAELLTRYAFDELHANILAVISNYNDLQGFVSKFGIPFHYITHEHKTREQHESAIKKTIDIYNPEYLVLAKYMRILTPEFVSNFENKIINIHHSFLPAFVGASPYKQAYERGVKIIGATAHFVNNELDQGPIIAQDVKHVDHSLLASDMAREGKDVEKMVLINALKLVFTDRVFIHENRTIIL